MDYNSSSSYYFTDVHATFNAAPIQQSSNSTGTHYSSWVGFGGNTISGHSSKYVLQVGLDMKYLEAYGTTAVQPFWEVGGYNSEQPIGGITIHAGDEVYIDQTYTSTNGGTLSWYIEDETTGKAVPGSKSGLSSYYDGTEGEAITEANQYNGTVDCGDFGSVNFSGVNSNDVSNEHWGLMDSSSPYQIWKLTAEDQYGRVLIAPSTPTSSTSYVNYWHNYT